MTQMEMKLKDCYPLIEFILVHRKEVENVFENANRSYFCSRDGEIEDNGHGGGYFQNASNTLLIRFKNEEIKQLLKSLKKKKIYYMFDFRRAMCFDFGIWAENEEQAIEGAITMLNSRINVIKNKGCTITKRTDINPIIQQVI